MPEPHVARVRQYQLAEGHLVAGKVQNLAGRLDPVAESDLRQVAAQELNAARDVGAGEFGAVTLRVGGAAQVPHVMKQRQDDPGHGALRAELPQWIHLLLIARAQARHGEGHIERVLAVVINGINAGITGSAAREHVVELSEGVAQSLGRGLRPGAGKELLDRQQYRRRRTDPDRVGDVEVAAPDTGHAGTCRRRNRPLICRG